MKYRETGFDTEFAGSFVCNDDDYNILWRKATRTCYLCMRDHFMDCPDRERTPTCLGDVCIQNEEIFYLFDTKAHQLVKDAIKRTPDFTHIIDQNLMFAGECGTWFYYMNTGDIETIREQYPHTKRYLESWELDESGVTKHYTKGWDWIDWGSLSKDKRTIQCAQYYYTLKALRKMAAATGNEQDLPEIDAKLKSIKDNFDKVFWKGSYYKSSDVSYPDERANAMAVVAGLASKDKWESIYENVLSQKLCPTWFEGNTYNASCYFERWVMEALIMMGREEFALLRMYDRHQNQIDGEFSSLTEHYARWWQTKFDPNSTMNHGWNSPNTILSRFITGLEPIEAAWSRFQIEPKIAFLTSVNTTIETIKGKIDVAIDKSSTQYTIKFNVPAQTKAEVGVPKRDFTKLKGITLNDKPIWKRAFVDQPNIEFLSEDSDYIRFVVEPGEWVITAHGALDMSSPKAVRQERASYGESLNKREWVVTASQTNTGPHQSYKTASKTYGYPDEAIDGDNWTNWSIGAPQTPVNQWFQIDLGSSKEFDRIVLNNEWSPYDFPRFLSIYTSDDGVDWGEPIMQGRGEVFVSNFSFPKQNKRYIKLVQEGADPFYWWSIHELTIFNSVD